MLMNAAMGTHNRQLRCNHAMPDMLCRLHAYIVFIEAANINASLLTKYLMIHKSIPKYLCK